MKKIITTIIMMLVGIAASAQIVKNGDHFELQIGDYVFSGSCSHGYYNLCSDVEGYTEVEELAAFISRNLYALNKKYGVMIREVQIARSPIYDHGVKTAYSSLPHVYLGIATKEYDEWVNQQYREREERLNSLNTVL